MIVSFVVKCDIFAHNGGFLLSAWLKTARKAARCDADKIKMELEL